MSENEKPLVTFALIAYNQENFIRDAVEGAFAQTYEPLEIILSDDCSTDGTFRIMQEMAAGYKGPHKIMTVRNSENLGVLRHVQSVADHARGEFFIIAAGDDISKADRSETLVCAWQDGYHSVCSAYDLIDPRGVVIAENQLPKADARSRLFWLEQVSFPEFVYGASSAYKTEIIRLLPKTTKRVMSEDSMLNTFIQVYGLRPKVIKESLVMYRAHGDSISNSHGFGKTIEAIKMAEERSHGQTAMLIELYRYILEEFQQMIDITVLDRHCDINSILLKRQISFLEIKLHWNSMDLASRLKCIANNSDFKHKKWMLLRFFGLKYFYFIKKIVLLFSPASKAIWTK